MCSGTLVLGTVDNRSFHSFADSDGRIPSFAGKVSRNIGNVHVTIPGRCFTRNISTSIRRTIGSTVGGFRRLNTAISRISLPRAGCNIPICCVVTSSRTSSGLRHFSNVHCKFHTRSIGGLRSICIHSHSRNFNSRIGHHVVLKAFSLSTNACSTFFGGTTRIHALVYHSCRGIFRGRSLVLKPATPAATCNVNRGVSSPIAVCVGSVLAVPIGLTKLPKVSLPTKFSSNLPVKVRLITPHFERSALCGTNFTFRRTASFRGTMPRVKNRGW